LQRLTLVHRFVRGWWQGHVGIRAIPPTQFRPAQASLSSGDDRESQDRTPSQHHWRRSGPATGFPILSRCRSSMDRSCGIRKNPFLVHAHRHLRQSRTPNHPARSLITFAIWPNVPRGTSPLLSTTQTMMRRVPRSSDRTFDASCRLARVAPVHQAKCRCRCRYAKPAHRDGLGIGEQASRVKGF
jgi:hypothetical protein